MGVYLCFVLGFNEITEVLKVHNVSKVPAPPKKPVPEEKVPVPVPVPKKAPPPRGRTCLKLLTTIYEPGNSCCFSLLSSCADPLSLF